MSATINEDAVKSVSNQEGQIGSHVPPSEPLEKGGHKPGVLASAADKAGEFHIETLPAGSAPASATHAPNNAADLPAGTGSSAPAASDTLGGATSAAVHAGLGHPGSGQTSREQRHDGGKTQQQGGGLEGVGAAVSGADATVDHHDPGFASQRGLGKEEAAVAGQRGTVGGAAAEETVPVGAGEVAGEAPKDRSTRGVASEHAGGR